MESRIYLWNLHREKLLHLFSFFNRDVLRAFTKRFNIPRGRNKKDTLNNLIKYRDNLAGVSMTITFYHS